METTSEQLLISTRFSTSIRLLQHICLIGNNRRCIKRLLVLYLVFAIVLVLVLGDKVIYKDRKLRTNTVVHIREHLLRDIVIDIPNNVTKDVRAEIRKLYYNQDLKHGLDRPESSKKKQTHTAVHESTTVKQKCKNTPDCLIIGFEKCGTVTLKKYLTINPKIFAVKENNKGFNPTIDHCKYQSAKQSTPGIPGNKVRVEKLSTFGLPRHVYNANPKMKLIVIVRDPVARLISHFVHRKSQGLEDDTFEETVSPILDKHLPNAPEQSYMFTEGMYAKKLDLWLQHFSKDSIHVVNGTNFIANPSEELRQVEAFLGLKPMIRPTHFVFSEQKGFYCVRVKKLEKCMGEGKGRTHPVINGTLIRQLKTFYRPYNEKFYQMFGKNYSWDEI